MEIKQYLALIRRWSWLIVLSVVISGSVAFLVSKNTTSVYRAQARFLINEAPGARGGNEYSQILTAQRLAQTYVQIITTNQVMEETIRRLGLPFSPEELKGKISVNAPQETQILIVSVEDTDPQRAADIANMVGEVFTDQNLARENQRYAEPIANWQNRMREIGAEIEELDRQINELRNATSPDEQATLARLETQRNEARIRYTDAFNKLNDLQVSQIQQSNNVHSIEPAVAPGVPIRPRVMNNTLLAAVTGGLLALGIIFLIEYLDDTVKTPDQVVEDTGLSTLGAIAQIKAEQPGERLIAHNKPRDPISEAYRVLRTNLSFSAIDKELQDVLVTSASPGEGKSTTTANLATVIAQTGKRVIVVDADLRRPMQHKLFSVPNNQGLTTALLDQKTAVAQHIQPTAIRNLSIMTSGPLPPNPAELLNSQRMTHVMSELRKEADVVLYDTPPVLTVADASILASQVDGCILVVEAGKTRRDAFVQAVQRLQKADANLFGTVMNRLRPGRSGYYYDYYYYYYHYYGVYEQENQKRHSSSKIGKRGVGWLASLMRR